MKSDVKRKLVTGSIEVVLGIGVLIYSWIKDLPLLYMGLLLIGSGLFTLIICGLRILLDKKAKENEANAVNAENGQPSGKKKYRTNDIQHNLFDCRLCHCCRCLHIRDQAD